jgi:hypothetical protein
MLRRPDPPDAHPLSAYLKTLSDHFQELGADFGEEIERRAADAKLILDTAAKHGVPVEMLWKPSGTPLTPATGRESGNSKSQVGKRD